VSTALVHDWLTGMRGGEKVLASLARLYPDAPIFTLIHNRGSVSPDLEAREIHTTFIQRLPRARRGYRSYLPLFPAAVATLNVRSADLVISSSHCVAKAVQPGPQAFHVCYCHTPMRYVWDRYDDYFGPGRVSAPARMVLPLIARWLRHWDRTTALRVHHFVANSAFVAQRIARYYSRSAEIVPPPVDTDFFVPGDEPHAGYDLIVSALVPYKRIDLAIQAYAGSGRRLVIVGSGPEEGRLRSGAPPEVEFRGQVDDETLRATYQRARCVLLTGVEDFGIVPIEAMACGRPAIVFAEGGGGESVIPGVTGITFAEATPQALRVAVDAMADLSFNTGALRAHAVTFSRPTFEARFRSCVERAWETFREISAAC